MTLLWFVLVGGAVLGAICLLFVGFYVALVVGALAALGAVAYGIWTGGIWGWLTTALTASVPVQLPILVALLTVASLFVIGLVCARFQDRPVDDSGELDDDKLMDILYGKPAPQTSFCRVCSWEFTGNAKLCPKCERDLMGKRLRPQKKVYAVDREGVCEETTVGV